MLVLDKIGQIDSRRKITDEGFLLVPGKIARAGIYQYLAGEIGYPAKQPDDVVNVYRPPEYVFDEAAINSFLMKPVTLNHPPEMLSIENVKMYQVGHIGSPVQDGDYIAADILITDKDAIKAVQDGQCELSSGYDAEFDFVPGYTADGMKFDATMKNIRGNHIAIVDQARGGSGCRISDRKPTGVKMKKIVFDGLEVETTEQGAQVVEQLQAQLAELNQKKAELEAELARVTGESQAQIDEMSGQLEEAKAAVPSPEELDQIVEDRAALINDAKSVFSAVETKGKTSAQIIEAVVVKVCDGIDLSKYDDKTKGIYCRARFDALVAAQAKQINDGSQKIKVGDSYGDDPVEAARQRRIKESETAYKLGKQ